MIIYDQLFPAIEAGWYQRLTAEVPTLAAFGVTVILLPQPFRCAWDGTDVTGERYSPVSDLDLGQFGTLQPGSCWQLQALVFAAAECGVRLMFDLSIHQYGGAPPYYERDAEGVIDRTLAPKPVSLFGYPEDHVFAPSPADGVRCTYQTSEPKGYLLEVKCQSIKFLTRVTGAIGYRFDEAKDESVETLRALAAATPGTLNMLEYFDSSNAALDNAHRLTGQPVMDLGSHYAYVAVSQGAGLDALVYWERYCHLNPDGAIVMVDNHDTDGADGVVNNKLWMYFDAATQAARGVTIYGGDYEARPALRPVINNYIWIGAKLAWGAQSYRVVSADVLIWTRDGDGGALGQSDGLLCGISRDPIGTRWVWTYTLDRWRNCWIKNYAVSGGPWVWVNGDGWACIPLPPNYLGGAQNAVAYSTPGQDGPIKNKPVTLNLADPLDFSKVTATLPEGAK